MVHVINKLHKILLRFMYWAFQLLLTELNRKFKIHIHHFIPSNVSLDNFIKL